ncbi:dihydroorotase family protein [Candidatus Acetothermia bacterium]|nr:dihydroorotase family protein [Candidatus Acetothermia bacterium]MBI3459454.1 dihydroorotase family protein [Candidatus Acetothermia bacterium]MBI3660169.1 dihydroorotase family protein [Candidatus Acetothermia bacterium]
MPTILANGQVFIDGKLQRTDIAFDQKIQAIGKNLLGEPVDCLGKIILPGAIDVHVHFRDFNQSHKEDWQSGSHAAVRGGVTTVFDMPNNDPPATTVERLQEKRRKADASLVNGKIYGGLSAENVDQIAEIAKVVDAFKLYLGDTTGHMIISDRALQKEIVHRVAETGKVLAVHAQRGGIAPEEITAHEAKDLQYAIELSSQFKAKLHLAHVTTRAGVETILDAKRRGLDVSFETCPQYLFFTTEERSKRGAFMKVNPPVATAADRDFLWEALRAGKIDMIATDHAPHTIEEKNLGMEKAPSGLPGVEFVLPLLLDSVNAGGTSLEQLVKVCCARPAQRFGFPKGKISAGLDADLVVIDMNLRKTITRSEIASKCGWSPYETMTLQGWPVMTFVQGQLRFRS